ncbi:FtsX-like permease family protein [Actinoplanes sp. CA-252034]|uniref:ABC transporter permease n=1 Tax=Actinoplanes sp. CA-252034 TaxID=3239906 RepID=UPI003D992AC8
MTGVRSRKVARDLRRRWGRTIVVVAAMALAVLAVTAVSTSYSVARSQQLSGYLATDPPSATISARGLTPAAPELVRAVPGVAAADTSRTLTARIRRPGEQQWQALRLTVRDSFVANRIARLTPGDGVWPPPDGQIVLESSGLRLLDDITAGGQVEVELPGRPVRTVPVAGTAADPGLPPSWVEGMVYGYVTPQTVTGFGVTVVPAELRIVVDGDRTDPVHIRSVADAAVQRLTAAGVTVSVVDVPEPGAHPHQEIMNGMLRLELLFGALAVLLSVLLIVTVVSGLLAGQVRQIGTMKAVGATWQQIAGGYLTSTAVLAFAACLIGWPLGRLAGLGFVGFIAEFMNFEVTDESMPWWLIAAQLVAGVAVPLLVAGVLVIRACRIPPVAAMRDHGVTAPRTGRAGRLARGTRLPRIPLLGARNAVRRRGRLVLAAAALSVGGAMFMAAFNVSDGLADTFVEQTIAAEPYDLTVTLDRPYPISQVERVVNAVPGIARAETWTSMPVAFPAGGTGQISGVPSTSPDLRLKLTAGRWLQPGEDRAMVLSADYVEDHPGVAVGSTVTTRTGDQETGWTVVGVAVQVGSPSAWVDRDALAAASGTAGTANTIRLISATHDPAPLRQDLENALTGGGMAVAAVRTQDDIRKVLVAHQIIFVVFLNLVTVISVVVGGLGLATILTVAITERTREMGVLRSLGATDRALRGLILAEAVTIGVVSWLVAAVFLAVPATVAFGGIFGNLLLNIPLTVTVNGFAVAGWLLLVCGICVLAALLPARRAARMTVRQALAYE